MKAHLVLASAFLAGCTGVPTKSAAPQVRTEPELHVMATDACPVHQNPKAEATAVTALASTAIGLAAAVGGKLVSSALDKLASYLGDDQVVKIDDSVGLDHFLAKNGPGVKIAGDVRCLVMVVAPAGAYDYQRTGVTTKEFDAWFDRLKQTNLAADKAALVLDTQLRDEPSFYAEFDVSSGPANATERTVTQISPKILVLNKFSGDESWRLGKGRDILFSVSITSAELSQPVASLTITLTGVTPGHLGVEWLLTKQQPWVVLPAAVRKSPEGILDDRPFLPANLTAVYSETAHPHLLAKALSEAIKSQEASASTSASNYVKDTFGAGDAGTGQKAATQKRAN
jgi:hypothetical protein